MEAREILNNYFLCFVLLGLLAGCGKKNVKNKVVHVPIENYQEILELAHNIDIHYETLQKRTQTFLNQNQRDCFKKCMTITIIKAGSYYIDERLKIAKEVGKQAYSYSKEKKIAFPEEWKTATWAKTKGPQTLKKLLMMKDFMYSCNNKGFNEFKKGNIAFTGYAKYLEAANHYRNALSLGLEDKKKRKMAYLKLAVCLYHQEKLDKAKNVYFMVWNIYPKAEINFGNQKARDYFSGLWQEFQKSTNL